MLSLGRFSLNVMNRGAGILTVTVTEHVSEFISGFRYDRDLMGS